MMKTTVIGLAALALLAPMNAQAACQIPRAAAQMSSSVESGVNALRRAGKRGRLRRSARLASIAQRYACVLAEQKALSHRGPDGSSLGQRARRGGYRYCRVAENLARGQASAQEVIEDWEKSMGHRNNLLRRGVTEIGVGIAWTKPTGAGSAARRPVWVLMLGRPC